MGRWLDRLKQPSPNSNRTDSETGQDGTTHKPTEPTKAPSVGFVGSVSGGTPKTISVHREIARACNLSEISLRDLEAGLSDDDLADIRQGIVTAEMLAAYAGLFRGPGYFWKRDASTYEPWEGEPPQQPMPPVEIDKPSASNAWPPLKRQARDQFISHVMECSYCYGPRDRYCESGSKWREFFYSM